MTQRRRPTPFARLAALQHLAGIERRRLLRIACEETDHLAAEGTVLAADLRSAEADLDAVHREDRLCPVRLRIAAAIVEAGEDALAEGRERLGDARAVEKQAGAAWLAARHHMQWFADRARAARKAEADRRDEAADCEARTLRLALGERDARSGT